MCNRALPHYSATIGICVSCLRTKFPIARSLVEAIHADSRAEFDLPAKPLSNTDGIRCTLCSNECVIGEAERGFCGLRTVRKGKLIHCAGTSPRGLLHWYRDPLPTNCVADWICEGSQHPGSHNLAVFYKSCTANCLFCQNWHFRRASPTNSETISALELASAANSDTFCVCFFGGDPSSQMPHALAAAKHLAQQGVRVCWETNGMMHPKLLNAAVEYSVRTGGCIKFDLKAFDEEVHLALTGVSNRRTKENFIRAARRIAERPKIPLVIASTLLVPGYIDADQVSRIADFVAKINPEIPYALLAFAPNFHMCDSQYTSIRHAREAEAAARGAGLDTVRIGNQHLLGL
ncbi:MAG: radical SAM protein [Fidelibacterota bacterium]|nr:MAG: radical SAM protein [Candidatus Neomarinimicrobiota bacterium]